MELDHQVLEMEKEVGDLSNQLVHKDNESNTLRTKIKELQLTIQSQEKTINFYETVQKP